MSKLHDLIHERFMFISVIIFILSSSVAFALNLDSKLAIDVGIDIFGILIGITSIILVLNAIKSFKGYLRKSFYYITYGIAFQILALIEHVLKDLGYQLSIDIHHILMIIGIIFFTMAVFKLRNMLAELK